MYQCIVTASAASWRNEIMAKWQRINNSINGINNQWHQWRRSININKKYVAMKWHQYGENVKYGVMAII
jgi:hypothetical protein